MNLYVHVTDDEKIKEMENVEKCLKLFEIGVVIGVEKNRERRKSLKIKGF